MTPTAGEETKAQPLCVVMENGVLFPRPPASRMWGGEGNMARQQVCKTEGQGGLPQLRLPVFPRSQVSFVIKGRDSASERLSSGSCDALSRNLFGNF